MMTQMYYVFGKNITKTGVLENVFHNISSDIMSIEVYGNFSGEIIIEGRIDKNNETYSNISGLNIGDLSVAKSIKASGLYQYGIEGLRDIRVNILSLNGSVNITAKIVNSAE